MLGGMGSALGRWWAGSCSACLEAFAAGYVSSQYKDAVAFLVILLVLFAMPRGLFGKATAERVWSMRALLEHRPATAGPRSSSCCRLFPSAYYYRVAALVFVFALASHRAQLADGLRRTGEPGSRRLHGDRRLRGRHRPGPSRRVLARPRRRRGARRWWPSWVGRPILRLKGHYLAVATLGFGLLLAIVFTNEARFTGGPDGMSVLRGSSCSTVAARRGDLVLDRGGELDRRRARAQPDRQPDRARCGRSTTARWPRVLGVDVASKKLMCSSSPRCTPRSPAPISRCSTAHHAGRVRLLRSIELVAMVVLGGMGSVAGSLVGAALLVVLPQTLTFLHDYEHMVLASSSWA